LASRRPLVRQRVAFFYVVAGEVMGVTGVSLRVEKQKQCSRRQQNRSQSSHAGSSLPPVPQDNQPEKRKTEKPI
jgi:hypothetical protein